MMQMSFLLYNLLCLSLRKLAMYLLVMACVSLRSSNTAASHFTGSTVHAVV